MTLRIPILLLALSALTLPACVQTEWEPVAPTPIVYTQSKAKTKKPKPQPPEEDDSTEPKHDLLR